MALTFSSLPTPDALRSVCVFVETAPALRTEPPLIYIRVQQLTGPFWDVIAHGNVVLLGSRAPIVYLLHMSSKA
jgi:hypothetical protein